MAHTHSKFSKVNSIRVESSILITPFVFAFSHWHKNGNASSAHQRKKKGHIPDEIYFNSTGMKNSE